MKVVRLIVKGFGPYVEEQQIDFRQMENAALFLITGPTGSGKTTILDAICFGLYGDTSGGGRDARQMRSDFLQPSQMTEITLDFDIGPESYRVQRTPAQVRPRRRGNGTTEDPPTATLWRRTGVIDPNVEGEVIGSQPTNVTAKVTELLGFECSQFRQVVLLPQGEFRKFLSATSREREQILEVLFQTEAFRHIEEELKLKAKALEEEIEVARQRHGNFLEAAEAQSEDELLQRRKAAQLRLQELDGPLEAARKTEITAQETSEAARSAAEKLRELQAAESAFSTVKERETEVASTQLRLTSASKAELLLDLERTVLERGKEHASAVEEQTDRQRERAHAEQAESKARERLAVEERRSEERETSARELQHLSDMRGRVDKIALAAAEATAAEKAYGIEAAEQARLDREVQRLAQTIEARDHRIATLQASAQRVDFLSLTVQQLEVLLQNRRRLDRLTEEFGGARDRFDQTSAALSTMHASLLAARQRFDEMQTDWLSAQAAVLAAKLMVGAPCPVCGSVDHPMPTTSEGPLAEERELKLFQKSVRQLEAQSASLRDNAAIAQNEVTRLETETGNLITQLGEAASTSLSQLTGQLQDALQELADSRRAAKEAGRTTEEQNSDRANLASASSQLDAARSRVQTASNRLAAAHQAFAERQDGVPESIQTPSLLEVAIRNASARVAELTTAYETARTEVEQTSRATTGCVMAHSSAQENEQKAADRARQAREMFSERLAQVGFDTPADFDFAKTEISNIGRMEGEIKQFEADLSAAQSRLHRARQAAAGLVPPDLPALELALSIAKENAAGLVQEHHRLSESVKSADRFLGQLNEAQGKLRLLETAHGVYGKIAGVACGDNQMRVTFQRYVQGALFEDVLQAASLRLRRMSKGRFELQRGIRIGDGRQSGGLDIVVVDSHTGTTRPVSSLSGGEGFMASLSLALGLADVVQNHTGGVRLESLFIDEGFGSLDSEALDQALQVLTDLRQSGRSIGIISHVTELKERISARIEVVPKARGSFARIVGGILVASAK
jgi:exonuclease SbcC